MNKTKDAATPTEEEEKGYDALQYLHEISFLSRFVERIFFYLSKASPGGWFIPSRAEIQNTFKNPDGRIEAAKARGLKIEVYQSIWIGLELISIVFITSAVNYWVSCAFGFLMAVRIIDIIQASANISLFDYSRIKWRRYYIENKIRSLILSIINFVELIVCFGFIYSKFMQNGKYLVQKESVFDGYYFSAVTQLTIGYGDISPTGIAKYIAIIQGLFGFIFTLLILSRFVSLLPNIDDESENNGAH